MSQDESTITSINIGGLQGRMLHLPAPEDKERKILIIYGLHSSIERMHTTAEFHNQYGEVTMPDLPGFGGMESFYKVNREPSLDSYADYLYTFMKSRKLTEDVTVVAMSFGFLAVTRMFQKYPDSYKYVKDIISVVGFGKWTDFTMKARYRRLSVFLSRIFRTRFGGRLVKILIFNRISLRGLFWIFSLVNPKYQQSLGEERKAARAMELDLWTGNDTRTKFYTWVVVLTVDLTTVECTIPLQVYNMYSKTDQYFDSDRVRRSLEKVYETYTASVANTPLHAPSILGDKEEIDRMYSEDIKQLLSKS